MQLRVGGERSEPPASSHKKDNFRYFSLRIDIEKVLFNNIIPGSLLLKGKVGRGENHFKMSRKVRKVIYNGKKPL